jgi:D-alanyl-D-alanine carboxypeptidase
MQSRIGSDTEAILKAGNTNASTIAVVLDAKIVYSHGYGMRDMAASLPADANTRYEIGSITKQFTAAAILQLKEAGKLSLDATLATYLPDVPHAKDVTIRQLLTHTSGMPEYLEGATVIADASKPIAFDGLMARIAGKPLDFTPGSKYAYSNTNYIILGHLIATLAKQSYNEYRQTHIFAPLSMSQTTTIADEAHIPDMALGYVFEKGKIALAPPLADSWVSSAGNIVTTVADLETWNEALASGKVVSPEDYATMITPPMLHGR